MVFFGIFVAGVVLEVVIHGRLEYHARQHDLSPQLTKLSESSLADGP